MPEFDILGLGAVAIDELIYVEVFPPPDVKTSVQRTERQCGGLTATALVAAQRLGSKCAYAGVLGTDELSDFAVSRLAEEGIDLTQLKRRHDVKPVHSFIVVGEAGHTRNVFSDSRSFTGPTEDWPEASVIRSSKVLLVDHFGLPGMIRAAGLAREAGVAIVGDAERESGPRFRELIELVDHLILSVHFAQKFTGATTPAEAAQRLWSERRAVVIVTAGAQGCWFLDKKQSAPQHFPAFPVKTVDTTGCGDVFHGAYASALARGLGLEERIRFASAAAALKATRAGGQSGIPTRKLVEDFFDM